LRFSYYSGIAREAGGHLTATTENEKSYEFKLAVIAKSENNNWISKQKIRCMGKNISRKFLTHCTSYHFLSLSLNFIFSFYKQYIDKS